VKAVLLLSLCLVAVACHRPEVSDEAVAPSPQIAAPPRPPSAATTSGPRAVTPPAPAGPALAAVPPAAAERARATTRALRDRDWRAFADLVDPQHGVRFSPYSYVADDDVQLSAAEVRGAWRDGRRRRWGAFDGSGEPIVLSFAAYYRRFVYDADFAKGGPPPADFVENTANNASARYGEHAVVVELYLPPSEPGGFDWRALRVVLTPREDNYYVVGIVHAQWTI
jgi:hypothetical protein